MKKWLNRVVDGLKRLIGKDVEALSAIVGNVVGAIFSFLGKADGLFIEHTWSLNVFVPGIIGGMVDSNSENVDTIFLS